MRDRTGGARLGQSSTLATLASSCAGSLNIEKLQSKSAFERSTLPMQARELRGGHGKSTERCRSVLRPGGSSARDAKSAGPVPQTPSSNADVSRVRQALGPKNGLGMRGSSVSSSPESWLV